MHSQHCQSPRTILSFSVVLSRFSQSQWDGIVIYVAIWATRHKPTHPPTGADLGFENGGGAGGVIGVLAWSVGLKLGTARPKIGGACAPCAPPPWIRACPTNSDKQVATTFPARILATRVCKSRRKWTTLDNTERYYRLLLGISELSNGFYVCIQPSWLQIEQTLSYLKRILRPELTAIKSWIFLTENMTLSLFTGRITVWTGLTKTSTMQRPLSG